MKKIEKKDFNNWRDYYWHYQHTLASEYYIPELEKFGVLCANKKILEIGCGNGGFIAAFKVEDNNCYGLDIKDMNWENTHGVAYKKVDIFDDIDTFLNTNVSLFDIVILRDVVEHIDNNLNEKLFSVINNLSKDGTDIVVTFPPFYSAFGLHQQSLIVSLLRFFPFLSVCPRRILICLLKLTGNPKEKNKEISELYDSKMTISSFEHLVRKSCIDVIAKRFYFSRPSHRIRYGLPILVSRYISKIPLLREFFITGAFYILRIRK